MISKLFKKDKEAKQNERQEAIEEFGRTAIKWNLEDVHAYVRGQKDDLKTNDIGLAFIMTRFNTRKSDDKKSPTGKRREFEVYDRVERTKKGFDIVLSIAAHKELSVESIDLIKTFSTTFADVIKDLDTKLSQTYAIKLKEAYKNAELRAFTKAKISKELHMRYKN